MMKSYPIRCISNQSARFSFCCVLRSIDLEEEPLYREASVEGQQIYWRQIIEESHSEALAEVLWGPRTRLVGSLAIPPKRTAAIVWGEWASLGASKKGEFYARSI